MTTLLLARHGETDWNRDHRWQGPTGPPLNEKGRRQAEALTEAPEARRSKIDAIGEHRLGNGFTVRALRCRIVEGAPSLPATGEIAEVAWRPADALPVPRSNVLHYAVPDAVSGRRDLLRTELPRRT